MNCPKCRKEIDDNILKCPHCGMRINVLCPKCKTLNRFGRKQCKNCSFQFLIYCKKCKSANLPNAQICRKCGAELENKISTKQNIIAVVENKKNVKKEKNDVKINNGQLEKALEINEISAENAFKKITYFILDPEKKIISLCGADGFGKSSIIKKIIKLYSIDRKEIPEGENDDFETINLSLLYSKCSAITQISPFGVVQEFLLNKFKLPHYCTNIKEFIQYNKEFFRSNFDNFSANEILDLINFIYPHNEEYYEKILYNKKKTYDLLKKVFNKISNKQKLLFLVDNIQFIDATSFEFLNYILADKETNIQYKILFTSNEYRAGQTYFYNNYFDERAYETISLSKLSKEKFIEKTKEILKTQTYFDEYTSDFLYKNFEGNLLQYEYFLMYLKSKKLMAQDETNLSIKLSENEIFAKLKNFPMLIEQRIENIKGISNILVNILLLASILGYKFGIKIVEKILNFSEDDTKRYFTILRREKLIQKENKYTYSFISLSVWQNIFELAKQNEKYNEYNKKILELIKEYTLCSSVILALISQNNDFNEIAFKFWTKNIKLCAYIGDINLYCLSQKQCLRLLERVNLSNKDHIKNNISERVGKLIYLTLPEDAVENLAYALRVANENGQIIKQIDLCSYFIKSCEILGRYFGVIEATNLILSSISKGYELEKAIIASKKLKALFYIGNLEEVVQISQTDVLPQLEYALSLGQKEIKIPLSIIFESWLDSSIFYSLSLALQGNDKVLEVVNNFIEALKLNNIQDANYIIDISTAKALFLTLKGEINESNKILTEISTNYPDYKIKNFILTRWNLISLINRILIEDFKNLNEDLYSLSVLMNNLNDEFSKNLIKCFLGLFFEINQNSSKALSIYNEQITYFSKEKNATGAIFVWFLIARIVFKTQNADEALEIAVKALEIASNSKINNIFFVILLQKLIAEIYIVKNDLEATKMYLEKSILMAKKYNLQLLLSELYCLYGKYCQELILRNAPNREHIAKKVLLFYENAIKIVTKLELEKKIEKYNKFIAEFKTYCQLNKIEPT